MTTNSQSTPHIGASVTFRTTMTVAEQALFTGNSGNLGPFPVDAVCGRRKTVAGELAHNFGDKSGPPEFVSSTRARRQGQECRP